MFKWAAGMLAGTLVMGMAPTMAAAGPAALQTTRICKSNGFVMVHTPYGTSYVVRNAFWRGQRPQCILVRGHWTNFRVVQRAGFDPGGRVVAYPDIFRGCIWHICSPKAHLPREVSRLGHPKLTFHTTERAAGTWNAAFDIWFGKTRMITGQATGAELMIWLNEHGGCCFKQPGAPIVWVAGHRWWLSHWRAHHNGFSWNYIQFRRVRKTWRVDDLRLHPFIRRVERLGLVKPNWWMENVEAGFEIWSGGQGLATTRFRVRHVR